MISQYCVYKKAFVDGRDLSAEVVRFELWNAYFAPPKSQGWECIASSHNYEAICAAFRLMGT